MKLIIILMLAGLLAAFEPRALAHENHHNAVSGTDSAMQREMAQHQEMEAVNAFPNYHPLIVHFPIVLLLIATIFQLISFFVFKNEFSWATLVLLFLAVLATWLASNIFHAHPGALSGRANEIFETHEQMATLTWWFSLAALAIKLLSQFLLKRKLWVELIITLLLVTSAVTVSIAGHHGSMLVHMEGIGPMGKYLAEHQSQGSNEDNSSQKMKRVEIDRKQKGGSKNEKLEEGHHVGEPGKGPHGGTIEEADPFHLEIVTEGNDLVFYLLDDEAKPLNMNGVTGKVNIKYPGKSAKGIELMVMGGKLTAMDANKHVAFTAMASLTKDSKTYSASFDSSKDLPAKK